MKPEELEELRQTDPLKFKKVMQTVRYTLNSNQIRDVIESLSRDEDFLLFQRVARGQEIRELVGELSLVIHEGPKIPMPPPEQVSNDWKHPDNKDKPAVVEQPKPKVEEPPKVEVEDELLSEI